MTATPKSPTMNTAPRAPATADPFGAWSQGLAAWDPAPAQEMLDAWACACGVWGAYLARMATATSPVAAYDAGAQMMTDSLEIFSRATAVRLRDAGLRTPLLNDA